jgi:hypothetical protein
MKSLFASLLVAATFGLVSNQAKAIGIETPYACAATVSEHYQGAAFLVFNDSSATGTLTQVCMGNTDGLIATNTYDLTYEGAFGVALANLHLYGIAVQAGLSDEDDFAGTWTVVRADAGVLAAAGAVAGVQLRRGNQSVLLLGKVGYGWGAAVELGTLTLTKRSSTVTPPAPEPVTPVAPPVGKAD